MKRRVALVEFSLYDQFPLASAYLHSYAQAVPEIAETFEFVYYNTEVDGLKYREAIDSIRALDAEILCIGCYVWNMGLVKRLVADLRGDAQLTRIVLGGHQASHHLPQYGDRSDQKTITINGQGEAPFRALLQRLSDSDEIGDLQGVTSFQDGELRDGGEAPMLTNLDDIPSPFLEGYFDGMAHPITVFETNRGCPYKCSFCTWGGDTISVTKFSLDRVKEELSWIAKKPVPFLYLADANWGMLGRDIEISDHIARLHRDHGCPWMVYYAAAKNRPTGSIACIEKFHQGGVITSQALGIQSMDDRTLSLIGRKNIRTSAFVEMFKELETKGIDSYCELIWPLPGETFESLTRGFERLLALGARTVIMYPAILINNSRMTEEADEHGIRGAPAGDWRSELILVEETRYADRAAVDAGFWFYYAYFLLANCDPTKALLRYLAVATGRSPREIVSRFVAHLEEQRSRSRFGSFVREIIEDRLHGSILTMGRLAVHVTHEERLGAQMDVASFILDETADDLGFGIVFALLWALSVPRLFAETDDEPQRILGALGALGRARGVSLEERVRVETDDRRLVVKFLDGAGLTGSFFQYFGGSVENATDARTVTIEHPLVKYSFNPRDLNRNIVYAHGMLHRLRQSSPLMNVL